MHVTLISTAVRELLQLRN